MCESRARGGSYAGIPGKMAQLRLYPRVLFPAEIAIVHSESAWPSGGTMRQCATMQDESFYDSNDVDSRGHSCAWFREAVSTRKLKQNADSDSGLGLRVGRLQRREQSKKYEYVCSPPWVKDMCPCIDRDDPHTVIRSESNEHAPVCLNQILIRDFVLFFTWSRSAAEVRPLLRSWLMVDGQLLVLQKLIKWIDIDWENVMGCTYNFGGQWLDHQMLLLPMMMMMTTTTNTSRL
eukprot:3011558-Rhodomonas_salina.5